MKVQDRSYEENIGELVCDGAYKYVSGFAVEINGERVAEYDSLDAVARDWKDYKLVEPLIKDKKIRKVVRAWVEAENCTSEMNLYYTLNRQEKYIIFHNPQTGSELQLCEFDYPDFKELCEYTIAELCGEEEE